MNIFEYISTETPRGFGLWDVQIKASKWAMGLADNYSNLSQNGLEPHNRSQIGKLATWRPGCDAVVI